MRAIVYHKYGSPDVLQLKEVEKPTPKDDEVLIRIDAASANALDWHLIRGTPFLARLVNGLLLGSWVSMTGRKKIGQMETAKPNKKDLVFIKELLEAGKVVPVIDRTYPLSEVPEAIRYLEAGHAKGKVVITVEQNNNTSL